MAKVQVLAVLSLDGCLSEKTEDASWVLRPEGYGIDKLFDAADYELTPLYPTSRLAENNSESLFLIEATHDTTDYINGLMRLQLIDEVILYMVPFIAGTGRHLFKANLPASHWSLIEKKEYNGGILRTVYRKKYIQE
ncbi:MAG: deaminase [Lachnospiraceae bacterium]|nr:deaminase [Lachnospiraceae bacterium]